MAKITSPHITLDDVVRITEAFPHMVRACQRVDALDPDNFHILGDDNRDLLYEARLYARQALKKLEG